MIPPILIRPARLVLWKTGIIVFFAFITCLSPIRASAQNFHWNAHKRGAKMLTKACDLPKKRSKKSHKSFQARNQKHRSSKPSAERAPLTASVAKTTPQPKTPAAKPEPVKTPVPEATAEHKVEKVNDQKLEQLHHKEDEVLAENKLPQPSSEKHEQVRKMVAEKLKNKPNSDPVTLAPLYFTFDQDEFSIVDMEPFLVATEYALQGHTVLIEGHTDSRGADDYNVQLSIKRVQKIRQLMLDMGVPDDRISVVGYGEEMKTNSNNTNQGRQLNRRVDFTVF